MQRIQLPFVVALVERLAVMYADPGDILAEQGRAQETVQVFFLSAGCVQAYHALGRMQDQAQEGTIAVTSQTVATTYPQAQTTILHHEFDPQSFGAYCFFGVRAAAACQPNEFTYMAKTPSLLYFLPGEEVRELAKRFRSEVDAMHELEALGTAKAAEIGAALARANVGSKRRQRLPEAQHGATSEQNRRGSTIVRPSTTDSFCSSYASHGGSPRASPSSNPMNIPMTIPSVRRRPYVRGTTKSTMATTTTKTHRLMRTSTRLWQQQIQEQELQQHIAAHARFDYQLQGQLQEQLHDLLRAVDSLMKRLDELQVPISTQPMLPVSQNPIHRASTVAIGHTGSSISRFGEYSSIKAEPKAARGTAVI